MLWTVFYFIYIYKLIILDRVPSFCQIWGKAGVKKLKILLKTF